MNNLAQTKGVMSMTEWVGIKWLMQETGIKSHKTLQKRILVPYREELEKFVRYPKIAGEPWKFSRVHMQEWLRNNVV